MTTPPTKESLEMLKADTLQWRDALRQMWSAARMERDRTIVTLSGGGIGLLVTLMTAAPPPTARASIFYGFALLGFVVALIFSIWVFSASASYVEEVFQGKSERSRKLDVLDAIMLVGFGIGVSFSVLLGILSAVHGSTHHPLP